MNQSIQTMESNNTQFTTEFSSGFVIALASVFALNSLNIIIFRVLVYRLIYKKGSLLENPINVLILVSETESMLGALIGYGQLIIILYETRFYFVAPYHTFSTK